MADTPVIEKFLQAIEGATIPGCDAWDPDATLDATVPGWRLHAAGRGRHSRRIREVVR